MRPVDAHRLTVAQHSHVLSDDLLIAETRPAVVARLVDQLGDAAPARRDKERLPGDRVVKGDRIAIGHRLEPRHEGARLPRVYGLCALSIEAADPAGQRRVEAPAEAGLRLAHTRPVRPGLHQPLLVRATDPDRHRCHLADLPAARVAAVRTLELHEPLVLAALSRGRPARALLVPIGAPCRRRRVP
eukprot:1254611-Prymnesium_polylepis.3